MAVRITREGFDKILSKAVSSDADKGLKLRMRGKVRLQWDPDHAPSGAPEKRRAIQLGLRAEVTKQGCLNITLATPLHVNLTGTYKSFLTLKYCYSSNTLVLAKFIEHFHVTSSPSRLRRKTAAMLVYNEIGASAAIFMIYIYNASNVLNHVLRQLNRTVYLLLS